jgi:hypothetical protein
LPPIRADNVAKYVRPVKIYFTAETKKGRRRSASKFPFRRVLIQRMSFARGLPRIGNYFGWMRVSILWGAFVKPPFCRIVNFLPSNEVYLQDVKPIFFQKRLPGDLHFGALGTPFIPLLRLRPFLSHCNIEEDIFRPLLLRRRPGSRDNRAGGT